MFVDQLRAALVISWLVVSTVLFPVLLAPFLLSPQTVAVLAPQCDRKARYGRECILCGMTTSFILISRGKIEASLEHNKAAIPLYSALVWNECVAVWYSVTELRRTWTRARRPRTETRTEEFSCQS